MSENARNVAVGLTVLGGIVLLAVMILLFTGLPRFLQAGYDVNVRFTQTHGVHEGDAVYLVGIRVGTVTDIDFTEEAAPVKGVTFRLEIDRDVDLPGNVCLYIYTKGLTGAPYLVFKKSDEYLTDPRTGERLEWIPKDYAVVVPGVHHGSEFIPSELRQGLEQFVKLTERIGPAMESFRRLADNLNALVAPRPAAEGAPGTAPATGPGTRPAPPSGLRGTLAKIDKALDAFNAVFADPKSRTDIKQSLANLAEATTSAREAMDALKTFAADARQTTNRITEVTDATGQDLDELMEKLIAGAERMSGVMARASNLLAKVEAGEGTIGRLIEDPKLYHSFVEAVEQLSNMLKDVRLLLKAWNQGGVPIKLK